MRMMPTMRRNQAKKVGPTVGHVENNGSSSPVRSAADFFLILRNVSNHHDAIWEPNKSKHTPIRKNIESIVNKTIISSVAFDYGF
jgi:hypothetical protein